MDSEWKFDNLGQKYREVGKNCIEYAPIIVIDGIEIYEDELEEFHRRRREAEEKRRAAAVEEPEKRPEPKSCPFSIGCNNTCKRESCYLFIKGKCAIAILADAHGTEQAEHTEKTQTKKCPFSVYGRCKGCALNNNGCAIVRLAAATLKGE